MHINVLGRVLKRPGYALLAVGVSLATFALAVWLPNLRLLWSILGSQATLVEKIRFAATLLESIRTNFTLFSASYTIAVAILFGVYIALLTYLIRGSVGTSSRNVAIGTGGIISGLFGIGCAACGSFLLMTLFGWAGSLTLIGFMPLRGQEFGVLAIALLLFALYHATRQIDRSAVCIP